MRFRRGNEMKCLEVQSLIKPYIEKGLADEKLEPFIQHIQSCKDCREELELYMMIYNSLNKDPDALKNLDFQSELSERLRVSTQRIKLVRMRKAGMRFARSVVLVILLMICMAAVWEVSGGLPQLPYYFRQETESFSEMYETEETPQEKETNRHG